MFLINIQSYPEVLEFAGWRRKTIVLSYPQYVLESSNKTIFIAHTDQPEKFLKEYSPINS